jgi:hypothetical protein
METAKRSLVFLNMADVAANAPGATGASLMKTKSVNPQTGAQVSVPCFVMCIPDPNNAQFKVAVRTPVEAVSKSLMQTLQTSLGAL